MQIKVAKFGGSSVADANQFKKVKQIIQNDPKRRYIIPSAPGKRFDKDYKITDLLYLCHAHTKYSVPFDQVYCMIEQRYMDIIKELHLDMELADIFIEIKQKIQSGVSVDYIASRGEYLNGLILAKYLGYDFVDPKEMIVFDEYGRLDGEKTKEWVSKKLMKHPKAVIPGFYGATNNGEIKTFSRGGSDITGSIIAEAVGAMVYENWTDVSGFLMADPRVVKNPKRIEKITYHELRELSYMGATVLHEESVFPVKNAGIPIHICNTNDPDNEGTLIVSQRDEKIQSGSITGIAGKKDFTVIAIRKNQMQTDVGFIRRVLSILETHNVPVEHVPTGIDTLSIVIEQEYVSGVVHEVVRDIKNQCAPDTIDVYPNMALIATVGEGMAYTPGVAAKLFHALAKADVNIRMIDQGSSEMNIIVGVEMNHFEKAMQSIYEGFVSN